MNPTCEHCGDPLVRRTGENRRHWHRRRYCSLRCYWASVAQRHEDVLWLIQQGTPAADALDRCGLTARGAHRWALRHGRRDLIDAIRPAYRAEQATWARGNRRKASA